MDKMHLVCYSLQSVPRNWAGCSILSLYSPSALIQSLAAMQSKRGTSPPYIDVYLVSSDEL